MRIIPVYMLLQVWTEGVNIMQLEWEPWTFGLLSHVIYLGLRVCKFDLKYILLSFDEEVLCCRCVIMRLDGQITFILLDCSDYIYGPC